MAIFLKSHLIRLKKQLGKYAFSRRPTSRLRTNVDSAFCLSELQGFAKEKNYVVKCIALYPVNFVVM